MATRAAACYDPAVSDVPQLVAVIRERSSEILASWIVRFERSPLRFRRATKAATYTAQVANLVEALIVAATSPASSSRVRMRPGSWSGARPSSARSSRAKAPRASTSRRCCSSCATSSPSMVNAEDAAAMTRLFEWLTVVALDTFAASGLQSLRERVNDQLELGTPVVELLPKVPAVFLVGAPNAGVIDGLLARAWMLAVGTGAPCLIIDASGLAESGEHGYDVGYKASWSRPRAARCRSCWPTHAGRSASAARRSPASVGSRFSTLIVSIVRSHTRSSVRATY